MTVYVVNINKDDLGPAQRYGELKFINMRYVYPDELERTPLGDGIPAEFVQNMRAHLAQFNPLTDYLLICGDHLQLVAFAAMLGEAFKQFRVLRWDRQANGYVPVMILT